MAKKLTVSAVNSAAKKVMREHHLTDVNGEIWTVAVDEKMNPAYAANMAQDILILMAKLKDEKAEDQFDFEHNYNVLLFPMIFKYFTDLEITEKKTAVETINAYINMLESLVKLQLLDKLMECFDKDSMQNTIQKFGEVAIEMSNMVVEQLNSKLEETEQNIEEAE